jgi:tetratricopeptide (TPR) repeat protein
MARFLALLLVLAASSAAQDEKPAPTIPDLIKTGQASYMRGDYEAARQSYLQAWDLAQQTPREDPIRYDVLKRLTSARAAAGEWADADNFLQLAISWREQTLGADDPKIPDDVLLSVGFARALKDYDRALWTMRRVQSLHARKSGFDSVVMADDFSRIAQIQAEQSKPEEAVTSLQMALRIRTGLLGPLDPSLVYDLDRLGSLQVTLRAYEKAEETYRHALVIRETLFGKDHADLIATVDGLGYALFGQKKYDEAEPVYQRLLALWISSVKTEKHPMVAIALDKVAVFYAAQKKWDQARDATTRANAIRAFLLADGLSVEASQRIDEGKLAEALPIYLRGLAILDPPNPIYDSERADLDNMRKEIEKVVKPAPAPAKAPPKKK